jgi:Tfp pilus assembly protein PilO
MGWGRWLLLGDLGQQMDLEDQRDEAERLRRLLIGTSSSARAAGHQLKQLQHDVDELKLYLAAMLRLMAAKGLVTSAEVKDLVASVDQEAAKKEPRPKVAAPPARPDWRRSRRP